MNKKTCCFFGHRKILMTPEIQTKLYNVIHQLIQKENVDTFLFGSKSQFNDLCYLITTTLKQKYPHINRIYVRAEFPEINDSYKSYLLKKYEDTYFPSGISKAGKAIYVERNYEMIDRSEFCITYFDAKYIPSQRINKKTQSNTHSPESGTKIAYNYAIKKQKTIINIFNKKSLLH